jgi:DNA invertase Pin-like site-specific DNA recombinase
MKAGYARVSTKDQTVDLQVDALKKADDLLSRFPPQINSEVM